MLHFKKYSHIAVITTITIAAVLIIGLTLNRAAPEAITDLVEGFGSRLNNVELIAPAEIAAQDILENYSGFVTEELLEKWMGNPENAPGRGASSPWPDRIEISNITKLSEIEYEINGTVIWLTSVELAGGGAIEEQPVALNVIKEGEDWKINEIGFKDLRSGA